METTSERLVQQIVPNFQELSRSVSINLVILVANTTPANLSARQSLSKEASHPCQTCLAC